MKKEMKKLGMVILVVVCILTAMAIAHTERSFVTATYSYETIDPYGGNGCLAIKEVKYHGSYKKEFIMARDQVVTYRRIGRRLK